MSSAVDAEEVKREVCAGFGVPVLLGLAEDVFEEAILVGRNGCLESNVSRRHGCGCGKAEL